MLKLPPKPFWVVHDVMWVCTKEDKYKQVCTAVCRLLCSFLWSFSFPLFLCHSCLTFRVCVCESSANILCEDVWSWGPDPGSWAEGAGLAGYSRQQWTPSGFGQCAGHGAGKRIPARSPDKSSGLPHWLNQTNPYARFPSCTGLHVQWSENQKYAMQLIYSLFFFSVLEICSACTWYRAAQLGPFLLKGTSWGLAVLRFTCFRSRKSVLKHCPFLSSAQSEEKYILLAKLQTAR